MHMRWVIIFFCFMATTALASEKTAGVALAEHLEAVKTFSGRFEQRILDAKGNQVSYSKGRLIVSRPGKFLWEGLKPDHILVIADGRLLWHFDIELEQVTKQPLEDALSRSPAGLFIGKTQAITDEFDVSYADKKHCVRQAESCFKLEPKSAEKEFRNIFMSMRQGMCIALSMHDQLEQHIVTEFSAIKVNEPVKASVFNFTPPEGVDVIETVR